MPLPLPFLGLTLFILALLSTPALAVPGDAILPMPQVPFVILMWFATWGLYAVYFLLVMKGEDWLAELLAWSVGRKRPLRKIPNSGPHIPTLDDDELALQLDVYEQVRIHDSCRQLQLMSIL